MAMEDADAVPAQVFFPEGFLGEINSWQGYLNAATGVEPWPARPNAATQVPPLAVCMSSRRCCP